MRVYAQSRQYHTIMDSRVDGLELVFIILNSSKRSLILYWIWALKSQTLPSFQPSICPHPLHHHLGFTPIKPYAIWLKLIILDLNGFFQSYDSFGSLCVFLGWVRYFSAHLHLLRHYLPQCVQHCARRRATSSPK